MYYLVFALTLLTPVCLLAVGLCWKVRPPKREGSALAYRTELSARNDETWRFAHRHIAKLWVRIGVILLILTVVLMVTFRESYFNFFLWLIGGQMIFVCLSAFLVELLLKASFDQDGNPLEP